MVAAVRPRRTRISSAQSPAGMDITEFKSNFDSVLANVGTVIKGKPEVIRFALVAMLCGGHVLFEDLPGTGKSMLARALADSMEATTTRVQCTPDMLPGDITGSSIFDQRTSEFEFRPGPIFTNVLLADEINRATPKTQSALLEAMAERRVTADGTTYDLPKPFLVLATQNPIEQGGTFPLPEAQLDRFMFKLSMGYLSREAELEVMFANALRLSIDDITSVMNTETANQMTQWAATEVEVSREVGFYIVDVIQATRNDPAIAVGASPRSSIAMIKAARVLAACDGRTEVYPDDIRALAVPVLGHRVALNPDAVLRGENTTSVLTRVTGSVKAPLAVRG